MIWQVERSFLLKVTRASLFALKVILESEDADCVEREAGVFFECHRALMQIFSYIDAALDSFLLHIILKLQPVKLFATSNLPLTMKKTQIKQKGSIMLCFPMASTGQIEPHRRYFSINSNSSMYSIARYSPALLRPPALVGPM